MPRVTLSYRRDDSSGAARAIYDRLRAHYGADSVFMDIDAIEFGEDYRERIHHALRQTDYLLVLIGPRWLGPTANGRNRILDPNDPVRMEVERALDIGLRVVPVLLEHTPMPTPGDLPESLARLSYLNAAEISTGREFDSQMDRIMRFIDRTFGEVEARRAREALEREQELQQAGDAEPSPPPEPAQPRATAPPSGPVARRPVAPILAFVSAAVLVAAAIAYAVVSVLRAHPASSPAVERIAARTPAPTRTTHAPAKAKPRPSPARSKSAAASPKSSLSATVTPQATQKPPPKATLVTRSSAPAQAHATQAPPVPLRTVDALPAATRAPSRRRRVSSSCTTASPAYCGALPSASSKAPTLA